MLPLQRISNFQLGPFLGYRKSAGMPQAPQFGIAVFVFVLSVNKIFLSSEFIIW